MGTTAPQPPPGERLNRRKVKEPISTIQVYRGKVSIGWLDADEVRKMEASPLVLDDVLTCLGEPSESVTIDLGLLIGVGAWILSVAYLVTHYWSKI